MKNKKLLALTLTLLTMGCISVTPAMANQKKHEVENKIGIVSVKSNYDRKIVTVDGEKMSYIQLGDEDSNKSMVIVHGSAYNARGMVNYGELYAKAGYNVILVDLPGHYGTISEPKSEFKELGDSVANLMNKLVKDKKIKHKSEIQGWSLGGAIVLDMANRYPELISSAGVIDGSSICEGADSLQNVTDENREFAITSIITALKSSAVSQDVTDRLIAEVPLVIAPTDGINSDFDIDKVLNIDDEISDIKIPVHFFYASEDALGSLDAQKEMVSKIKKSKLYVADGYNHFAVLENPQLVFDAFKSMNTNSHKGK